MVPYREQVVWPVWSRLVYLALMAAAPLLVMLSGEIEAWPIALGIVVVLAFVGYRLATVDIRIDGEGVAYGFRGLRNRVPWSRIHAVSAEPYRFTRYLGWGYRIGGRRDRGYALLGYPRGLRVEFCDERGRDWSVFLSSADPEAAVDTAKRKVS